MYDIKNDLNETVTLEELIHVAASINADAMNDSDDEETWEELNSLGNSLESIIAYLFNLESVRDELSWEISEETDRVYKEKYGRRK